MDVRTELAAKSEKIRAGLRHMPPPIACSSPPHTHTVQSPLPAASEQPGEEGNIHSL